MGQAVVKLERAEQIADTWVAWLTANLTHTMAPMSMHELRERIAGFVLKVAAEEGGDVSALRLLVDELTAQRDAFGQKAAQLEARVRDLEAMVLEARAESSAIDAKVIAELRERIAELEGE